MHELCGFGLGVPTVELGELGFKLGGAVAVFFIKIGLCVQRVFFLCDLIQPCIALHDGIKNGLVFVSKVVLFQNGHSVFGVKRNLALTGL